MKPASIFRTFVIASVVLAAQPVHAELAWIT